MGMLFVSIEWKMKLLTWLCFGFSSTVVAGITLTVSPSNDVEVNQTVTLACQLDPNPTPPVIVAFANNFTDILCSLEYSNGKCINTSDACLTGYNASCHNETLYSLQVPVSWNWNGLSLYCRNLTSKSNSVLLNVKVPVMSVTLTPTPIFAIAGKQINITCTTPYCYPPADITWYINFENMPSKDIYRYTYKGGLVRTISTLSTTFNKSDNGNEMYCTARNLPYQGVNSTVYTVTVMFKPEVTINTTNPYRIKEGQTAILECQVTDANPIDIHVITWRWYRTDRHQRVIYSKPQYIIPNIQRNMSGLYICTVSNPAGTSEEVTISVDVLYKPEVTSSVPNPYIVIEGQTATLECTVVDANPNTSITWEWFRTESPKNIIYNESSYVIPNIQRNMSGFYSCIANNSEGTSLANTTVDVQYTPYIIAGPSIMVNDSDRVIISRKIESNPLANASWYSGPKLLKTEMSVKNATFIIDKVVCTDTRNITLLASNAVAQNVTDLVELIINCKPQSSPSNITLSVTDTTGIEFSATVIAHPEPRFELRYDNGTINNRMMGTLHRNAVNNFTIYFNQTVVEPNDYRTYHLIVSNSFGETAVFVNVLPQRKPSMPNITEIVCEVTSAKVQWISSFNGGDNQSFTVTAMYGQNKESNSSTISDKGENRIHSVYVQNLQPATTYIFYVSALNRYGLSFSENMKCTTLEESTDNSPIITLGVAAGGMTLAMVITVVVLVLKRSKKPDNKERDFDRNNPNVKTTEDASHYTTLEERDITRERNFYETLTQNKDANHYEACLITESQENNSKMYESLKETKSRDKRNIFDKQVVLKNPKDLSNVYVNHSGTAKTAEYVNLSFSN